MECLLKLRQPRRERHRLLARWNRARLRQGPDPETRPRFRGEVDLAFLEQVRRVSRLTLDGRFEARAHLRRIWLRSWTTEPMPGKSLSGAPEIAFFFPPVSKNRFRGALNVWAGSDSAASALGMGHWSRSRVSPYLASGEVVLLDCSPKPARAAAFQPGRHRPRSIRRAVWAIHHKKARPAPSHRAISGRKRIK